MNRHYALITNDMSWKAKAVRKLIKSGLQCLFVTAIECYTFMTKNAFFFLVLVFSVCLQYVPMVKFKND